MLTPCKKAGAVLTLLAADLLLLVHAVPAPGLNLGPHVSLLPPLYRESTSLRAHSVEEVKAYHSEVVLPLAKVFPAIYRNHPVPDLKPTEISRFEKLVDLKDPKRVHEYLLLKSNARLDQWKKTQSDIATQLERSDLSTQERLHMEGLENLAHGKVVDHTGISRAHKETLWFMNETERAKAASLKAP